MCVVVTGGAQGIGLECARTRVCEGVRVAIVDLSIEHGEPLGDCPEGGVIADAAAFLLSQGARFITGRILSVSGGAELGYRL
jgi:meso-butanediol dehydrogenase / (S,S)-butanediol dehydrogenase / diacetyl reductase